jgi:hypothetical protein
MLRAVRMFAVTNKDKVAIMEETGWLSAAVECGEGCYDHAVLLLDALEGLASLPRLVMGAAGTEAMLTRVLTSSGEREQCAALRLASRVLSLEPGMRGGALALEAICLAEQVVQGTHCPDSGGLLEDVSNQKLSGMRSAYPDGAQQARDVSGSLQ